MLIIAQHNIQDPNAFWSKAKEVTSQLPGSLKLHSVFPSQDMKTGTCIWEGSSVAEVQNFLDDMVGNVSKNFCYEVNTAAAIGIPKFEKEMVA